MAVTPPTPDPIPDPRSGAGPGPVPGPGAAPGFGNEPGVGGTAGSSSASPSGSTHTSRFPPDEPAGGAHASAKDVMASILERVGEIREYVSYYAETKTDGFKQSVTWAGIYAALGVLGGLIGAAVLITATVLLVNGIAGALAALFGHREWLGQLVTGLLLLGLFAGGVVFGLKALRGSFKKKLRAKYEQRHQEQRARFGADVPQRARERQEQPL